MSAKILLVEDEPGLQLTVSDLLEQEGYQVTCASTGTEGLAKATANSFDLLVLDVMLPGKNGFEVCKELRQQGCDAGILMLTAKSQVVDRVVGLKLGADDYLGKPFDPAELLARVEALLRRANRAPHGGIERYEFGDVKVDFVAGIVLRAEEPVSLAGKELQLLRYLIDHRNSVVPREELLEKVWEYQPSVTSRTVDVHVAWLRQKLEENPQHPRYIQTVRGVGYRFSS